MKLYFEKDAALCEFCRQHGVETPAATTRWGLPTCESEPRDILLCADCAQESDYHAVISELLAS